MTGVILTNICDVILSPSLGSEFGRDRLFRYGGYIIVLYDSSQVFANNLTSFH